MQRIYKSVDNPTLESESIKNFFKIASTVYKIKFDEDIYPSSYDYNYLMNLEIDPKKKKMDFGLYGSSVFYMSSRQNFLEDRMEDICLELESKGKYKQAE